MVSFLVFNWFRLVVGVTFDWSCDRNVTEVVTVDLDPTENTVLFNDARVIISNFPQSNASTLKCLHIQDAIPANETSLDDFWEIRTDTETNVTTYLGTKN